MILLSWGCDRCGETHHVEVSSMPGESFRFWSDQFRIPKGWEIGNERVLCYGCAQRESV